MTGRERQGDGEEPWLLSFADLVTLLLGFFVLLYATAAGTGDGRSTVADALRELVAGPTAPPPAGSLAALAERLDAHIGESGLADRVSLQRTAHGLEMTASGSLLFTPGSARLDGQARQLLDAFAGMLEHAPRLAVRVEGHSDDLPIQTAAYASNWELSTARASSVVRYLIGRGIAPQRLSAAGYADTRPVAEPTAGDPRRARAQNRRVVLLVQPLPGPR